MAVHQIKVQEIEFSQYLINARDEIKIQQDSEVRVNDYIVISEIRGKTEKETGKHLVYKLNRLDYYSGIYEEFMLMTLQLDKMKDVNVAELLQYVKE